MVAQCPLCLVAHSAFPWQNECSTSLDLVKTKDKCLSQRCKQKMESSVIAHFKTSSGNCQSNLVSCVSFLSCYCYPFHLVICLLKSLVKLRVVQCALIPSKYWNSLMWLLGIYVSPNSLISSANESGHAKSINVNHNCRLWKRTAWSPAPHPFKID